MVSAGRLLPVALGLPRAVSGCLVAGCDLLPRPGDRVLPAGALRAASAKRSPRWSETERGEWRLIATREYSEPTPVGSNCQADWRHRTGGTVTGGTADWRHRRLEEPPTSRVVVQDWADAAQMHHVIPRRRRSARYPFPANELLDEARDPLRPHDQTESSDKDRRCRRRAIGRDRDRVKPGGGRPPLQGLTREAQSPRDILQSIARAISRRPVGHG